jgi:hypothetical protein
MGIKIPLSSDYGNYGDYWRSQVGALSFAPIFALYLLQFSYLA